MKGIQKVLLLSLLVISSSSFAQKLSKEQKKIRKEWKKKMKKTDPLAFKKIVETQQTLDKQEKELEESLNNEKNKLSEKEQEISALEMKIKKELEKKREIDATMNNDDPNKGVVFRVQFGAYRNINLSDAIESETFKVEEDGEIKKYTLGVFRDYWKADEFKKTLIKMGANGAWIVAYRDGERVDIKDALEGII